MGYQLIEPLELADLSADPKYQSIGVAVMSWLIEKIENDPKYDIALSGVHLSVVVAKYFGTYPAIAAEYDKPIGDKNVDPLVCRVVAEILATTPAIELVKYISAGNKDWNAILKEKMKPYE